MYYTDHKPKKRTCQVFDPVTLLVDDYMFT